MLARESGSSLINSVKMFKILDELYVHGFFHDFQDDRYQIQVNGMEGQNVFEKICHNTYLTLCKK